MDWDETIETDSSGMVSSTNYRTLEELYQIFKERLQKELKKQISRDVLEKEN